MEKLKKHHLKGLFYSGVVQVRLYYKTVLFWLVIINITSYETLESLFLYLTVSRVHNLVSDYIKAIGP